jgi:HSP20 family protein
MANTPVPVKQSAPAPVATPDVWRSFRSEMDRLFDRVAGNFGLSALPLPRFETAFTMPSPAVDITEDEAAFKFTAELPGLTEKDVEVTLSGDTLIIKGEKRQDKDENTQDYHLTERSYGAFQRAFVLPADVESDKVAAAFANGVLTVTVPKTAKAAGKTIEVKAA